MGTPAAAPDGLRSCGSMSTRNRSPGSNLSAFIARHMEQPGSRQSKPASTNTCAMPSSSACCFTRPDPRHHHRVDVAGDPAALGNLGDGAQVFDTAIGAAADENAIDDDAVERCARFQIHVVQRPHHGVTVMILGAVGGIGHMAERSAARSQGWCPTSPAVRSRLRPRRRPYRNARPRRLATSASRRRPGPQ